MNNHSMKPAISIVIIDKNDRGINQTLNALRTQKRPASAEILVIDASAPDVLKDIKDAHPEASWHQFVPADPKKSSIPEQRNFGVRKAAGEIIVFIDANCVPVQDWLERMCTPILSNEEDITSGPFGDVDLSKRIVADEARPHTYLSCSGTGNLVFRKSVWERVGGFDETFLYGSDVDFTWRCIDAGYRIRSVPDAGVSHDWGTAGEDYRRSFKYGKARADLLFKHSRRRLSQLAGEIVLVPIYMIWLCGLALTPWLPWYPLTICVFLLKNMRHKPFTTVSMNLVYTIGFLRQVIRRLFA
jgi:cellulose synthase/poly-beta-1,6-N-acetylglucosamine synthase-like glycosyltransferase